jgi:hypothetical protein|tara:strand:- start:38646 stop:39383 length:738 start_codon:yes stop_codon:yes gene_type:complete
MSKTNIHHCHHCGKPTSKTPNVNTRTGLVSDKVFCGRECYDLHRVSIWKSKGFNCKCCGKRVEKARNQNNKFCSMECRSQDAINRSLVECLVCKVKFSAIAWNKRKDGTLRLVRHTSRKVCSPECHHMFYRTDEERKRKIGESERGDKHHNWQGGGTRRGYRGVEWPRIAERVRKRAGYKCEHCGIPQEECGRKLDVNHIEPFHQHRNKTQANRMSNLEALCKSCHMKAEWKWRKENQMQYAIKF